MPEARGRRTGAARAAIGVSVAVLATVGLLFAVTREPAPRARPGGASPTERAAAATASRPPQTGASSCARAQPPSGTYVATLCVAGPVPGTTVSGVIPVSLRVTESGRTGNVQRAVYLVDGSPILTAYASPFAFSLDTKRWPDGAHRLSATVVTRDGFTSAEATMPLVFSNASARSSGPPSPSPFRPTAGSSPAPGAPFVVAAVGDGASGEKGETATVNLIASWNPSLFLYLGDVYENGRPVEFDSWYGAPGASGLYGQFHDITDPTIGNHEYIGNAAPGYFAYWSGIPHYYSFDAAGWHFISLDSNLQLGQLEPGTPQYDWLSAQLSALKTPCVAVYYHHPLFNAGREKEAAQMRDVWQLLAAHHVTLVLNGHDHDYQRWAPLDGSGSPASDGVTELVVGSGGHGHQAQARTDARLAASDFRDFGALKLTLGASQAAYQFVTVKGQVADSGTVQCGATATATAPLPVAPSGGTATGSPAASPSPSQP